MKKVLRVALSVFLTSGICVDAVSQKLDNTISCSSYFVTYDGASYCMNYFTHGDNFFRVEDGKVQYFNSDFSKKWEHHFDKSPSLNLEYKYNFALGSDALYATHELSPTGFGKSPMNLQKFGADGALSSVDMTSFYEALFCQGIVVRNDTIFCMFIDTTNIPDPNFKGFYQATCQIGAFDQNLKSLGIQYTLPSKELDSDGNIRWNYLGLSNENYLFYGYYSRLSASGTKLWFLETLELDKNYNVISRNQQAVTEQFWHYFKRNLYDTELYTITSDKNFQAHRTQLNSNATSLEIKGKNGSSGNIIEALCLLTKYKPTTAYQLEIEDIVTDPINNTIMIFFDTRKADKKFMVQLNSELELSHVHSIRATDSPTGKNESTNFTTVTIDNLKTYGTPSPNHLANAFDLIYEKANGAQFTVLNFADYQILIEDNLAKKETIVYKITR